MRSRQWKRRAVTFESSPIMSACNIGHIARSACRRSRKTSGNVCPCNMLKVRCNRIKPAIRITKAKHTNPNKFTGQQHNPPKPQAIETAFTWSLWLPVRHLLSAIWCSVAFLHHRRAFRVRPDLLVLLHQRTADTATRYETVIASVAIDIVFAAHGPAT